MIYSPLASWTVQKLISHDIDMDPHTRVEIFWQLLEGLEFLHSILIIHRDIKPLNMTVVSINPGHIEARLIDFGWATRSLESHHYKVGTEAYLAPEIWAGLEGRSHSGYNDRADMFAFGLSMYQFFCRKHCTWKRIDQDWRGEVNDIRIRDVLENLHASDYHPKLIQLISQCLFWDPSSRSSATELIEMGEPLRNFSSEELVGYYNDPGSSMGTLSMDDTGLTTSSMAESSRDDPKTPQLERSMHHQSPIIRGPSGRNVSELDIIE
ncbi:kinase-like domain-containing protein [Usnea florida]